MMTCDAQAKLIRARAWETDVIEDWFSSNEQVSFQLQDEYGAVPLVVHIRDQEGDSSTLDIFDFGADWPRGIRTVILIGEESRGKQQSPETGAISRAKQRRKFAEEVPGLNWLRKLPFNSRCRPSDRDGSILFDSRRQLWPKAN